MRNIFFTNRPGNATISETVTPQRLKGQIDSAKVEIVSQVNVEPPKIENVPTNRLKVPPAQIDSPKVEIVAEDQHDIGVGEAHGEGTVRIMTGASGSAYYESVDGDGQHGSYYGAGGMAGTKVDATGEGGVYAGDGSGGTLRRRSWSWGTSR